MADREVRNRVDCRSRAPSRHMLAPSEADAGALDPDPETEEDQEA
jgi:hypothetical protein